MITRMFQDLGTFLAFIAVVILAFGTAQQGIIAVQRPFAGVTIAQVFLRYTIYCVLVQNSLSSDAQAVVFVIRRDVLRRLPIGFQLCWPLRALL